MSYSIPDTVSSVINMSDHQINDFSDIGLIPEYYIPSAYNLNTQEFLDRLNVLSMLIL
jgi:hypothetical protein